MLGDSGVDGAGDPGPGISLRNGVLFVCVQCLGFWWYRLGFRWLWALVLCGRSSREKASYVTIASGRRSDRSG